MVGRATWSKDLDQPTRWGRGWSCKKQQDGVYPMTDQGAGPSQSFAAPLGLVLSPLLELFLFSFVDHAHKSKSSNQGPAHSDLPSHTLLVGHHPPPPFSSLEDPFRAASSHDNEQWL